MEWIGLTIFAAFMQSIRTAGQKALGTELSPMTITFVRYSYGLPWAVLYVVVLGRIMGEPVKFTPDFFISGGIAGVSQIVATALLIFLLGEKQFAIGTVFSKTEVMLTAVLGVLFFSEHYSLFSWLGIVLCTLCVFYFNGGQKRGSVWSLLIRKHAWLGIGAGLGFAITAIFLRQASVALGGRPLFSAAVCLLVVVAFQSLIMLVYVLARERRQLNVLWHHQPKACFIGVTSLLGSVGWFSALSLASASQVRALGQIELLFALLIGRFYFNEVAPINEWGAVLLMGGGVVMVVLF